MAGRAVLGRVRRRRLWRTGAALAQTVGVPAATVAVSLAALRAGGVETWGTFVGVMVMVQLMAQLADLGSRDVMLRVFSRDPTGIVASWRLAAASRLPILVSGPILFVALGNDLWTVLACSAWLVALFVVRLHEGLVVYRRAFGFSVTTELMAAGGMVSVIVALGDRLSPTTLLVLYAGAAWMRALALVWRYPMLRPGPGWVVSIGELRRAWPFFALSLSGAMQSRVDLYVVAAILPAPMVGTYQVVSAFVLFVQSGAGALVGPVVPALYRLPRTGVLAGARRLGIAGLALGSAGITAATLLMIGLYHLDLAVGLIGAAWLAVLPVWWYSPLVHLAYREGRERTVLTANVAGLAVAGGGALVLVGWLGLTGAMAAAAAAQMTILSVHVVRTRRAEGVAQPIARPGAVA